MTGPTNDSSSGDDFLEALRPEIYDEFEPFLRQAVREYYQRGWKHRRGNFIALVLASGQIMGIAGDSLKDGTGLRKAAMGAASVVALRFALRYVLAGPVGWALSGAALLSAVAYLVKNQKEIGEKVGPYRDLVEDTRNRFEELQGGYRGGKYDTERRNLMVEGLLKRLLQKIDAA